MHFSDITLSHELSVAVRPFIGSILAKVIVEGRYISMNVGNSAAGIGRFWYDVMPITIDIPSTGELPELNIVLFGAEQKQHFRNKMAAAIKVCEIISGS